MTQPPTELENQIRSTALKYGVDPAIALAVAHEESGFNPNARGSAGEVGLYQLMPATADQLGVDPYDTAQNIQGGILYLRQLYQQFGDWTKALAAYNGGPGNVAKGTTPATSWQYAQEVLDLSQSYYSSGAPTDFSAPGSQASVLGDVSMEWLLLAAVAAVGLVVIFRRD